jgi:hypothetical protein
MRLVYKHANGAPAAYATALRETQTQYIILENGVVYDDPAIKIRFGGRVRRFSKKCGFPIPYSPLPGWRILPSNENGE